MLADEAQSQKTCLQMLTSTFDVRVGVLSSRKYRPWQLFAATAFFLPWGYFMLQFVFLLMNEYRLWGLEKATASLEEKWQGQFSLSTFSVKEVNTLASVRQELFQAVSQADMVFLASHGSVQTLGCFSQLWQQIAGKCPIYFTSTIGDEMAELLPQLGLTPDTYAMLDGYYQAGSSQDLEMLVLAAANRCFGRDYPLLPPQPARVRGIYYQGELLPPEEEAPYVQRMAQAEEPVVGVLIHDYFWKSRNLAHIDSLIRSIEERGCLGFALVDSFSSDPQGSSGMLQQMEQHFRRTDGSVIPASLAVTYGFSLTTLAGRTYLAGQPPKSVFEPWDLPVIQGLTTYLSEEEYRKDMRGLDLVSLPICVYQPEFDGQMTSVPFAVTETNNDGQKVCRPLPDRVERYAEMVCRWAKLSATPMPQKKIAIVLHNMPPREDTIGSAHGLDTPESVHRLVSNLIDQGLYTDYRFQSGADLIDHLRNAVTNDNRWRSDEQIISNVQAAVPAELYQTWFCRLPADVRQQMVKSWGDPPGTVMVQENQILLPGILNGHLFIGLQPLRSSPEQAEQLYHSTDSTPPHSYLAFYRWIDEVFHADAVIHVGTHGTLEWLPGKEVGLSGGCFPDICIGSIPHLYLYNIDILGEGMQAKRRSYACILDHMIPSMDQSDAYGDLAVIDEAIDEYYHAQQAGTAQVPELAQRIFTMAQQQNITEDLNLSAQQFSADPDAGVASLHQWISRIKASMVRDGLHIYGQAPTGIQLDNLARALVRIPNGNVPALPDSILIAQGWDPEQLRQKETQRFSDGRTALRIQEDALRSARRMFQVLSAAHYEASAIATAISGEAFPGDTAPLKKVLGFVCSDVVPKLRKTTDETHYLLAALDGHFVPPLPGGSPSRGNVHILPTGRNFYAIDPATVPSQAAWNIGQTLADQAIAAYRAEHEGAYPESMALVVYSDACMKTNGEDIAEVFALMGVRPLYLGQTNKVIGVEPIPLETLNRPRIDAVLRISGLFRDTFPNVIELVERAVLSVSALDESHEVNFVKKHTDLELEKLIEQGLDPNEALDQANLRVFGCPPGGYGAGVAKAIHARNWESWEDLSKVYALWSSHGYSSRYHGKAMGDLFRSRLSSVGVTIKNQSSVELDMLDSDDFFAYHGGLIACVRDCSGEKPLSIAGQTADPQRPETATVERELARVMRSRILNPKWLEGLKRHGYKGAQEISTTFDTFFGWDATAQVAQNWMYDRFAQQFLLDEQTRQWMEQVNDASVFQMAERMLEASKRGMWQASEEMLQAIQSIYMNAEGNLEDHS